MKKVFIVLIIIVVVVIGVAYFSGMFSSSKAGPSTVSTPTPIGSQPAPTTTQPTPTAQPSATATATQPATTAPATTIPATPSTTATATATQPASPTATAAPFVKFNFVINSISGSGFTRTVTAQVSNLGNEDATNVTGVVQVTQSGAIIKIDGQNSLTVQIGTIPAGTAVAVNQSITFGLLDGLKIQNSGATFTVTIHSDQGSATFTQFYQP